MMVKVLKSLACKGTSKVAWDALSNFPNFPQFSTKTVSLGQLTAAGWDFFIFLLCLPYCTSYPIVPG